MIFGESPIVRHYRGAAEGARVKVRELEEAAAQTTSIPQRAQALALADDWRRAHARYTRMLLQYEGRDHEAWEEAA